MTQDVLAEALAEGLHKAMCWAPVVLHNRLACERPQVYLALAETALAHPALAAVLVRTPETLLADTAGIDAARLRELLPQALADADDAGSDADDWIGSEYVDRMADSLAAALRTPKPEGEPE